MVSLEGRSHPGVTLDYTRIVPVLTLRFYFKDTHENNYVTIFFFPIVQLSHNCSNQYILRKTHMHNKINSIKFMYLANVICQQR